jgi:nitroreductase
MLNNAHSFRQVIQSRHSVRSFLPQSLPDGEIRNVLEEAQMTPSNCNTQPWCVHLVSGEKLTTLSAILIAAMREKRYSLDFTFDKDAYPEPYLTRASDQGSAYYRALGVARGDALSRSEVVERNVSFFGAPHAVFLFMPMVGDGIRVAADVGMYAQTFLLALAARGYAGIPQAALSYFSDTVRSVLDVPNDQKLLFGISFGLPDQAHPSFKYRQGRSRIEESVVWHI